jgi:hypothetical protein
MFCRGLEHGRAIKEGRRTGIPTSTLWVSAVGKRPRTQNAYGAT